MLMELAVCTSGKVPSVLERCVDIDKFQRKICSHSTNMFVRESFLYFSEMMPNCILIYYNTVALQSLGAELTCEIQNLERRSRTVKELEFYVRQVWDNIHL